MLIHTYISQSAWPTRRNPPGPRPLAKNGPCVLLRVGFSLLKTISNNSSCSESSQPNCHCLHNIENSAQGTMPATSKMRGRRAWIVIVLIPHLLHDSRLTKQAPLMGAHKEQLVCHPSLVAWDTPSVIFTYLAPKFLNFPGHSCCSS